MFIFSNLATSLDGKIATATREHFYLGTPEDRRLMQILRAQCDAVLIGASTLRAYKNPLMSQDATQQPLNIIVSSGLQGVSPQWPFFKSAKISRLLFLGPKAPTKRIKLFEPHSEIVVLKKATPRSPTSIQIIKALEKKGIQRLLVEGGGGVMWDFVSLNLIDEFHVTLTPWLIGGELAPTLVEGIGFTAKKALGLKLSQCRVVGDELYLTYRKIPKSIGH